MADEPAQISAVSFEKAARDAVRFEVGGVTLRVIGRVALLVNKRATARPKDLEDVRLVDAAGETTVPGTRR